MSGEARRAGRTLIAAPMRGAAARARVDRVRLARLRRAPPLKRKNLGREDALMESATPHRGPGAPVARAQPTTRPRYSTRALSSKRELRSTAAGRQLRRVG